MQHLELFARVENMEQALRHQWRHSIRPESSGWLSLSLFDFREVDDAAVSYLLDCAQRRIEEQQTLPCNLSLQLDRGLNPTIVPRFVQFLNKCQIVTMRLKAFDLNPLVHIVAGLGRVASIKQLEYAGPIFDPVACMLLETVRMNGDNNAGQVSSLSLEYDADEAVAFGAPTVGMETLLESLTGALQNGTSCLKNLRLSGFSCVNNEDMLFAALQPCAALEQLGLNSITTNLPTMRLVTCVLQRLPALKGLTVSNVSEQRWRVGEQEDHDRDDGLSSLFGVLGQRNRLEKLVLSMNAARDTPHVLPFLRYCCDSRAIETLELCSENEERLVFMSQSKKNPSLIDLQLGCFNDHAGIVYSLVGAMGNVGSLELEESGASGYLGAIFNSPRTCAISDLKIVSQIQGPGLEDAHLAFREYNKLTSLRLFIGSLQGDFSLRHGLCPGNSLQSLTLEFADRVPVILMAQLLLEQKHLKHLVVRARCTFLEGTHTDAMDQLNKALEEHPTLQTVSLILPSRQNQLIPMIHANPRQLPSTFLNGLKQNSVLRVLDLSKCDEIDMKCLVDFVKETTCLSGLYLQWTVINHQYMDQLGVAMGQNRSICVVRMSSTGTFFNTVVGAGQFSSQQCCKIVESLCHNQQDNIPSSLWSEVLWKMNSNNNNDSTFKRRRINTARAQQLVWFDGDENEEDLEGNYQFRRYRDITGLFLFVRKGASILAENVGASRKRSPTG